MTATWRPLSDLPRGALPPAVAVWLKERQSLTRRLQRSFGGAIEVRLAAQSWQRPMGDEIRPLRLGLGRRALVRQVFLCYNGEPLVYARTVIPPRTLNGPGRRLAFLGNRPLGEVLFGRFGTRRGPVEVARIQPGSALSIQAGDSTAVSEALWGRRSVFLLHNRPLLVVEIFLPALWSVAGDR